MSTELQELLDPTREEQDAAQQRIVDSLTTGQYDGMTDGARDVYGAIRERYGAVRDALRDDAPSRTRNSEVGAAVERRLRRAGVTTAPYDYLQVRVGDDGRELRFMGETDRSIDISGNSLVRDVYDSLRGRDDRSPGQVVRDGVARNAVRQEIRDAVETHRRTDVPHGVTRTVVFPRD